MGGGATSLEPVGALPYWRWGCKGSRCLKSRNDSIDQQCGASVLCQHLALPSSAPVGAVPSVDASVTARPNCKDSLMRHPPRLPLLVVGAAARVPMGTAVAPVVTASGAAAARTVEYSVTGRRHRGLQGAAKRTDAPSALVPRPVHRHLVGLLRRARRLPEADVRHAVRTVLPGLGREHLRGHDRRPRPVRRALHHRDSCATESCWNSMPAPVAARVPHVAGGTGENTCAHSFVDRGTTWSDTRAPTAPAGPGAPGTAAPGRPRTTPTTALPRRSASGRVTLSAPSTDRTPRT